MPSSLVLKIQELEDKAAVYDALRAKFSNEYSYDMKVDANVARISLSAMVTATERAHSLLTTEETLGMIFDREMRKLVRR